MGRNDFLIHFWSKEDEFHSKLEGNIEPIKPKKPELQSPSPNITHLTKPDKARARTFRKTVSPCPKISGTTHFIYCFSLRWFYESLLHFMMYSNANFSSVNVYNFTFVFIQHWGLKVKESFTTLCFNVNASASKVGRTLKKAGKLSILRSSRGTKN